MVDEISPSYYAAGEQVGNFVLKGSNFDKLPADAVGVIANDNDRPLYFVGTATDTQTFEIVSKTATTLEVAQVTTSSHSLPIYLGAIVSADRETIYWVNNTKPLP